MSYRERIIERMKKRGYDYDELSSHPHYLSFNSDSVSAFFPLTFKSWKEVDEWLKGTEE